MAKKLRVVHFLNQFFAGLGGEEKANIGIQVMEGAVGPGRALQAQFGDQAEIVGTIVSGDNYFAENTEKARDEALHHIKEMAPDVVVAGPAFNAGRYGVNCGEFTRSATEHLGIPGVTAMYPENPGVLLHQTSTYILPTGDSPAQMGQVAASLARFAVKLGTGEPIGPADEEGYMPRGHRELGFRDKPGWQRAVEMLLAKLNDQPFTTEIRLQVHEQVEPAPPVKVADAKLAVVVTSGLSPKGNPDGFTTFNATKWAKYPIEGAATMNEGEWFSVHGGYDTRHVNQNPNFSVPLDVLRELEDQGAFKSLSDSFYSTTGVGTPDASSKRIGEEIAQDLLREEVDAALLVST